jgi:hypothetical protein
LTVTVGAFADDKSILTDSTMADPKEVLKLFDNPSEQFSPRKEMLFINYLFNIDNYPQSKTFEVQRVFRTAVRFYQKKYRATMDFHKQERILDEMQKLSLDVLAHKNISGTTFYAQYNEYLTQLYQTRDAMNRGEIPLPGAAPFNPPANTVSLEEVLNMKVERAIARLSSEVKVYEMVFKDTVLEISAEDMPIQKSIGNVSYLAPKSERKKAYRIKIAMPSVDASEALAMVSQALLSNEKVSGLLFDSKIHIPTKMDANSYELFSYGGQVMLKKAQPLCSRLFQ